jgi:hypothetical protein
LRAAWRARSLLRLRQRQRSSWPKPSLLRASSIGVVASVTPLHPPGHSEAAATEVPRLGATGHAATASLRHAKQQSPPKRPRPLTSSQPPPRCSAAPERSGREANRRTTPFPERDHPAPHRRVVASDGIQSRRAGPPR